MVKRENEVGSDFYIFDVYGHYHMHIYFVTTQLIMMHGPRGAMIYDCN
jgi:hypothetical protein